MATGRNLHLMTARRMECLAVFFVVLLMTLAGVSRLDAHPLTFNSSMTYSASQPTSGTDSVANWIGAEFDADNIGGSGVNADGGDDNGLANDEYTYVANNQPVQGQTFVTGANADGYNIDSFTVRMTGYTNNIATGSNMTSWNFNQSNGPMIVSVYEVEDEAATTSALKTVIKQCFFAGEAGNPGATGTANGAGMYITFTPPYAIHLEPDTTYGFDFYIGNGCYNYFEWLGTSDDPFSSGTAYQRSGTTLTKLDGDRVFMVSMTAGAGKTFAHPGTLHTQIDLDRMKAKIAAAEEPWLTGCNTLLSSPYNNLGWPAYDVDYIIRGATGNNYTRCQQDAQLIYTQALIWHLTGDTAYADRAVEIANVWSDLIGVQGDTNASLAYGICGYLFAISGELLSTYPGWVEEDKQAYKDMMMRVFYPGCFDFLWRHHNTFITESGNTHYRLNWDTANMAAIAAIGVLCDNQAVYEQAVDFFKYGAGNGQIQRAAWYIHPDGTAQTEEIGRDQGHNVGGWYAMAVLCQTAWNQGDDLWGYDGNRVLRAIEHTNKYNLWLDVPWVYHRNTLLTYTETLSEAGRGALGLFNEMAYNHYVNIEGMAAPYTQLCAEAIRPEPWPNTSYHPSQVDWFGNGTLTFSRDEIATPSAPSGLHANWSADQIIVNWMGTARAGSYNVKRATVSGGPYTTIGTASALDLNYTDTDVANGAAYYYVVSAIVDSVESAGSAELEVSQQLMTHYTFDSTAEDAVGDNDAELKGGSTGAPSYVTGHDGQALDFDGTDDYAQLPAGIGNYQDITVAAWVYWDGGSAWQRVFDFGTEQEKWMFLTPSNGSVIRFSITTAKGADGTGTLNGPAMSTGVWTHIAVTLNGDTGTLYVNGAPVDAETIDEVDPLFGQPYCYLGKSMYNADPLFNGRIDDFRIYNYALSGADVWDLWGESADNPPAFASDPIYKVNATEDANYSSLSQSLSGDASDPDTGDTLTFSKVTGPDWLSVASGGALSGTPDNDDVGTNTFVVRVTDDSGATDDATLYIYVANVNDAPAWSADPISKVDGTWGVPYSDTLNGDASDVDAGDTLSYSKVDGPDWLSVGTDGTLSGTPGEGDVGANSFTVRVMDGSFAYDDATLEITVIGHTLQAYYEFEDDTTDSIGTNDGTAIGSPVYATGKIGQAIELDASDDYVTLPAGVASYWDITVAAWVYWNGGGDWQRIFDFGNNTNEYMLLTPSSGGNTLRFAITTGSYGSEQLMETSQLATGQWVHVVVTLEGDTGTLYVNGSPAASNSSMTINPEDFDPAVNYIGRSQYSDPLFNGMIDEFRIYNYALSATEVADLYAYEPVNNPPVFTSDPIAKADATEDADYALMSQTLAGSASDDDGDELTFSKVSGPDWLSVASSGALSGAPANDDVGVNDFVVQVSDGRGGTDDATLSIEVVNVNDAPEWDSDPLAKPNARAGAAYSGETLSGDASDIDAGDVLSFAKVSGPDWLIVAVDGALTGTPSSGDAGANAFTVEVSDGNDGSDEAALNIVVLPIILEELSTAVSSRWQIY